MASEASCHYSICWAESPRRPFFFSQRALVPVLWWEGQQRRHRQMLLFISILSCVWIWLQVAKSIFSFCGWHHRRQVYFFWAPPHLLPMTCAVADVCRYHEWKQTMSVQSWPSESGIRVVSMKPWFAARSQTGLRILVLRAVWGMP